MRGKRKDYSASFKGQVVMEVFRGQKTSTEIASHYRVHPNQITKWKRQAMDALQETFSRKNKKSEPTDEELIAELYQQIGRQKVEMEWLKKKSWSIS